MPKTSGRQVIGFPNQLASDAEKASVSYGLQVGQAIEQEWFRKDGGKARFYNNRDTFHKLRKYAMGEQSVRKYKDELAINGDISYLNLDWTPVPIIPKFVDIVVNGISNRLFDVKASAVDPVSSTKKAFYKSKIKAQMLNRADISSMEATLGSPIFTQDPATLPGSKDELELHMEIDYKDDVEIAEEKAIDHILKLNEYNNLKNRVDEDATVLGISAVKHSFNTHDGILVEYVDPADMVYSPTDDPKFGDCYYFGEVKNVNITELKKIDPTLTQADIDEIGKASSKFDAYQGMRAGYQTDTFDYNTATLLYFCYKTDKNIVYKKKKTATGNNKVLKKDDQFNPPKTESARFEKLSKRIDVWYEGVLVLGTNRLLKWDIMKNMVRPKSSITRTYAPFIVSAPKMYRGEIDSLVKRMIPFADQIQLLHLKLQQVASKMIPDGVYIDVDGISSISLGNGMSYTPQEALNLYFQTGSVLGRSYTEDGEFNQAKMPIQELGKSGANNKISSLINMYNYNLNMIRSVTGLNEARDGSVPDSNMLVGVQKLAALNSNTATRHILDSGVYITERLAKCLSYRISDVIEYSPMADDLIHAVGKYSTEILKEIKDIHLHDFGIYIELYPDEEEKAVLEQNIQTALSAGKIDIDDAIDIRDTKNVKLASQLLKLRKKKKEEKDAENQQRNIQAQAQANQQAAVTAEQSKQATIQAQAQADAEIEKLKAELELQRLEMEKTYKAELITLQKTLEGEVASAQSKNLFDRESMKEDRKDKRTAKQATQQSKLIQQRQQDLDPIDFDGQDSTGSGMASMTGI
jgi:hypothetical protein